MRERDLKVGTIIAHPKHQFITRIVDITDDAYVIDNRIESLEWFRRTSAKSDVTVWPKKFTRSIKPVKVFTELFKYNERFSSLTLPGFHTVGSYVRTTTSRYNNSILIIESVDGRVYVTIAKMDYNNPVDYYQIGAKFANIVVSYSKEIQYAHELQDFCEKHKLRDVACSHSYFPLCELDTASEPKAKKYSKDNTFNQKIAVINQLRRRKWAVFPMNNYFNYEDEK